MSQSEMWHCTQTGQFKDEKSRPPNSRHSATGDAGDIIIMDGRLVHRGAENKTPDDRVILSVNYGIGTFDRKKERSRPALGMLKDLKIEQSFAFPPSFL